MSDRIKEWIIGTTTPEFLEDAEKMYELNLDALVNFVKCSGTEFILNKNLDFYLGYHGSTSGPTTTVHYMSVALKQNKKDILYEEHYTTELPNQIP